MKPQINLGVEVALAERGGNPPLHLPPEQIHLLGRCHALLFARIGIRHERGLNGPRSGRSLCSSNEIALPCRPCGPLVVDISPRNGRAVAQTTI